MIEEKKIDVIHDTVDKKIQKIMSNVKNYIIKILNNLTDTNEIKDSNRRILAFLCMIIAILAAMPEITGTVTKKIFFFFEYDKEINISIRPSVFSLLASSLFMLSFVIRNRVRLSKYICILYTLNILFCSTFMNIFLGNTVWNVPLLDISSQSLLMLAIIMSWLCIRILSGIIWLSLFLIAVGRITMIDQFWGGLGVVYVLSAFIGILCQIKDTETNFIESFKRDFFGASRRIKEDVSAATEAAGNVAKTAIRGSATGGF